MLASTVFTCFAAFAALAESAIPKAPTLSYLYTLNATLAPAIPIGAGPRGNRVAIPITGGTFNGPKLNGTVLNLGADWGLTSTRGTFNADTRYNLLTSDGANIFIQTSGPAQPNGKLYLRMVFETGDNRYYWLNDIIGVGVLTAGNGWVAIEGWYLEYSANATMTMV